MENTENNKSFIQNHSWKTLFQIQLIYLITNLISFVFSNLYLFYTTVVLLPIELYVIASLIYMIYNMINDPIIGHGCDRSTRWTGKFGKRTPFIIIGIAGAAVFLVLLFTIPIPNPSSFIPLVFIWLLIVLIVYDSFYALALVNVHSLIQYKVRSDDDRMKAGAFNVLTGSIGIVLAVVLQPLVVSLFGVENIIGWTLQALIFALIIFLVLIIMIPGIRESKELREHREALDCKEQTPFLKALKTVLKSRSYDAYMIGMVTYQLTTAIVTSTISFHIIYVLNLPFALYSVPMILITVVAPLSAPVWFKLGKKFGSKPVYTISFIFMGVLFIPLFFVQDFITLNIMIILFAAALGCNGVMQQPVDADVIEEAAIKTGTRNEGVYNGIQTFFTTLGGALGLSSAIIGGVQLLTGFDQYSQAQTDFALIGIRLLISIIPAIIIFTGGILFYVLYSITPEKREENKKKLAEMNL